MGFEFLYQLMRGFERKTESLLIKYVNISSSANVTNNKRQYAYFISDDLLVQ